MGRFRVRTRQCLFAALLSLTIPAVAQADSFQYSFTGVVNTFQNFNTYLDLGAGPADLAGVSFTVTGLIGDPCCYAPTAGVAGAWASTPVWDFGALGAFSMEDPAENQGTLAYDQFTYNGVTTLRLYLWYLGQIDFQGFAVQIAALPTDPSTLAPFNAVPLDVPLATTTGNYPLRMTNAAGQVLQLGQAGGYPVVTITSVSVQSVPEPGTVVLLGVGIGSFVASRRRRQPTRL